MKNARVEMKSESLTCSNPVCRKVFANPIIVEDLSSKSESSYYACPYCLTEVLVERTTDVKEEKRTLKKKRDEFKEVKTQLPEEKPVPPASEETKCPHHFGHLSQRSKEEKIPEECMTCERIVQCMLKKVAS